MRNSSSCPAVTSTPTPGFRSLQRASARLVHPAPGGLTHTPAPGERFAPGGGVRGEATETAIARRAGAACGLPLAAISLQGMAVSLKYAVVERERRFLVSKLPDVAHERRHIVDRYVTGTRLRLREVVTEDGVVTRKLGHKVRLGEGPHEIACTSLYLDDGEWDVLRAPGEDSEKGPSPGDPGRGDRGDR